MPNLKEPLNVDTWKKETDQVVESAKRQLDEFGKVAIENLVEAERAMKSLPTTTADVLLGKAVVALTKEFTREPSPHVNQQPDPLQLRRVTIELANRWCVELLDSRHFDQPPDAPRLKPGKYRALLFILPVEE